MAPVLKERAGEGRSSIAPGPALSASAPNAASPALQPASPLAQLLKVESEARKAGSIPELLQLMANESRRLARARQVFVIENIGRGKTAPKCAVVSSLAQVDRSVPLVKWIESLAHRLSATDGVDAAREFVTPAYCDPGDETPASYPFPNFLWVPLWSPDGRVSDGLLLARETPWLEADRQIAARLAETFGHALALLRRGRKTPLPAASKRWWLLSGLLAVVALGCLPMPISALAPVEVVPRDPHVVAMPVDGIVQTMLVQPNETVKAGQPLVRLTDTVVRNKLELAVREVAVAEAKVERANTLAFSDPKGRHELGLARAELALRIAERNFARDLHNQLSIASASDGVAVFSDRKDIEGKPFSTGDRLLLIAQPGKVEFKIDLPVADSIVLQPGAKVRAFLDSDPLNSVAATVVRLDYQAKLSDANVAAYRIVAALDPSAGAPPRLGTRGTAQLQGPDGTLALFLFRRPISALRQWAGL